MTALRKTDRVASRQQRIVDSARELFLANGFHLTGTAQIAADAGIAVQQMYRDFGSKEGIVAAIVEQDVGELMRMVDSAVATAAEGRAGLRTWLSQMFATLLDPLGPDLRLEIFAEATRNDRIAAILADLAPRIRAAIRSGLAAYARPDLPEARLATVVEVVMLLTGCVGGRIAGYTDIDASRVAETLGAMIEREIYDPSIGA